jgi:hypothetical protein
MDKRFLRSYLIQPQVRGLLWHREVDISHDRLLSLPASLVSLKVSKEHYSQRLIYTAHSRQTGSAIPGKTLTLEIIGRHSVTSDDPYIASKPCFSDFTCFKKAEVCIDLLIPD